MHSALHKLYCLSLKAEISDIYQSFSKRKENFTYSDLNPILWALLPSHPTHWGKEEIIRTISGWLTVEQSISLKGKACSCTELHPDVLASAPVMQECGGVYLLWVWQQWSQRARQTQFFLIFPMRSR